MIEYVMNFDKFLLEKKNYLNKDYAGVLPYDDISGKFLLNLRSSLVNNPNVYSSWGGKIELGETPEMAAVREFKEECGHDITSNDLLFLHKSTQNKLDHIKEYYLYASRFSESLEPIIDFESNDYKWVTFDELYSMEEDLLHPEFYKTLQIIKPKLKLFSILKPWS